MCVCISKESACNEKTQVRSLGWENLMDRGSWWATVHGVARVRHDLLINHHQYQKLQEVVKTGKEACRASVHGLQSRTQLSD